MSVIVYSPFGGEYRSQRATEYFIDEHGALHVQTAYNTQIAVFAPGQWKRATVVQDRDSKGRFVSKESR